MGAGEALRRVLECLASGILMKGTLTSPSQSSQYCSFKNNTDSSCRWSWDLWSVWEGPHRCYRSFGSAAERRHHSERSSESNKARLFVLSSPIRLTESVSAVISTLYGWLLWDSFTKYSEWTRFPQKQPRKLAVIPPLITQVRPLLHKRFTNTTAEWIKLICNGIIYCVIQCKSLPAQHMPRLWKGL